MTVRDFADSLVTLALKYNMSCTSWGRTTARNQAVGGVADSYHLIWLGADVVFDGSTQKNVNFEQDANRVGLQELYEVNHYHLQPR